MTSAQRHQIIAEHERAKYQHTVRRHDGFYQRLGVTFGFVSDRADRGSTRTESEGVAFMVDCAIGGTPSPGLALAFGLHGAIAGSPSTRVDNDELTTDHSLNVIIGGALIDFYPDDEAGWHCTATLGFATVDLDTNDSRDTDSGLGLAAGLGYDFWVGERWSAGATARLLYVTGASDDFGDHRAVAPVLSITMLYH